MPSPPRPKRLRRCPAGEKKTLSQSFAPHIRAEVDRFVAAGPDDSIDFEAAETAVRRSALRLAARAVEQRLDADRSDYCGPFRPCPDCAQPARYAGRRPKTFETVLGPLTLQRAYYHCPACGSGCCPRDAALGLVGSSLSPGVLRMTGSTAALSSFAESSDLLAELAGVRVQAKQVERCAEALGQQVAAAERAGLFPSEDPPAPTMYLGLDGTGLPMRSSETAERSGKQADGSAKTREAKLVVVWTAESRHPKTGRPMRDPGSVSYSAAIESAASRDTDREPSVFAQRVRREAERRGFPQAQRRVVLGDGAQWIWKIAAADYPGAIQIVDLFHAKEHLHDVSKVLFPGDSDRARLWADVRCDELDDGCLDDVLGMLRSHAADCEEAAQCAEYIERNRERMQSADFRARGLCVASGVVESGCKTALGTRLKRSGMHWTLQGANQITALRCCILSGLYEDFWAYRTAHT